MRVAKHGDIFINNKNGCNYVVCSSDVINATNKSDGECMVGYYDVDGKMFVREISEFFEKFTFIK